MHLPSGIPTLHDLDALKQTDLYARHVAFNRGFLQKHNQAMAGYGRHWGHDPFKLWSRRWEYPYVAQRLMEFAADRPSFSSPGTPARTEPVECGEDQGEGSSSKARTLRGAGGALTQPSPGVPGEGNERGPFRVLDAGSGVTYFPYFLLDQVPGAHFTCCDYDTSYAPMFARINADRGDPPVQFVQCLLQEIPLPDRSLDAICCISVLEHTDNYGVIIREFARILNDGGLLVLTFDLSLDGKFTLPKSLAIEMLENITEEFDLPAGFDWRVELGRMTAPGILSSDHVRRTEPELLPWTFPVRVYKAMQDLVGGKGWTAGFRSRTVFCLAATKKRK